MSALVSIGLKFIMPLLIAGGLYLWINNAAYNRGVAATEKAAQEQINRMEARLKAALKKNETLTDPELDCELIRLRNPKAECVP